MAETLTSKLKLAKHDTGDLNWGADANANMDALDQLIQQSVLRPPRTLLATLGSGAAGANLLGGATYFYKVTAVNAVGETTEGQIPAVVEAQITQPATPLPVILQWETVAGATGYMIYKSTAPGQEQFLSQVAGQAVSTYTDTGGAATAAATVPTANTARTSVSQIVAGANVTVTPPDGTGAVTVSAAAASSTPGYPSIYGTGKDGSVTYAASATLAATDSYGVSAENNGFNVAEINCTDLTINAGVTLTLAARVHGGDPLGVNGLVIRSQGPVVINGIIDVSGKGAQVDTGSVNPGSINGLGLLYATPPSAMVFPALYSQGGPTGGGTPGMSPIAPGGGGGGNSGAYQGGSGGQAIRATTLAILQKLPLRHWGVIFLCGGSGGTGGGGGNNVGGNGGGFILIFAPSITIGSTGQILANGTNGNPNGTSAGSYGGGGGGAGGLILLAYGSLSNGGVLQANGGNAGQGGALVSWGLGGTNTTLNGQPTSGTMGGSGSPGGSGGGGAAGVILGIQVS